MSSEHPGAAGVATGVASAGCGVGGGDANSVEVTAVDSHSHSEAGKEERRIKRIEKSVANKICSGQVITCLANAVKELLENSLDAGASIIEVKLIDSGVEGIEVSDNGTGIHEKDFESLCHKYTTSKINNFDDVASVTSFGFRGEALSSLCALCSQVSVFTRTDSCTLGTQMDYDREGRLIKRALKSKKVGTTVSLKHLFSTYPVRRTHLLKQKKKQFNDIIHLLHAYALAIPSLKLICTHIDEIGRRKEVVNFTSEKSLKTKLAMIFRPVPPNVEFAQSGIMTEVAEEFKVDLEELSADCSQSFTVSGFVSKTGTGSSSSDKQYITVNKRPVLLAKLAKVINQVFRSYDNATSSTYPFFVLDITVPTGKVDVNVTPDKRSVMLSNENVLFALVKSSLLDMYGPDAFSIQRSRYDQSCSQISIVFDEQERKDSSSQVLSSQETDGEELPHELNPAQDKRLPEQNRGEESFTKITDFFAATPRAGTDASEAMSPSIEIHMPDTSVSPEPGAMPESAASGGDGIQAMDAFSNANNFTGHNTAVNGLTPRQSLGTVQRIIPQSYGQWQQGNNGSKSRSFVNNDFLYQEVVFDRNGHMTPRQNVGSRRRKSSEGSFSDENFLSRRRRSSEGLSPHNFDCDGPQNSRRQSSEHAGFAGASSFLPRSLSSTPLQSVSSMIPLNHSLQSNFVPIPVASSRPLITPDHPHVAEDAFRTSPSLSLIDYEDEEPVIRRSIVCPVNMDAIRTGFLKLNERLLIVQENGNCKEFEARLEPEDDSMAEDELKRNLTKKSFKDMKIIGQFNKSFILTQLGSEVFVVDQHASDERFNFDQLLATTILESQPLVNPKQMQLTAYKESVLLENMWLFTKNGFKFEQDDLKPPGRRLSLKCIPTGRDGAFGVEDAEEMLEMLCESVSIPQSCRPTRVKEMLASMACRKSIMINDSLTTDQMRKLLDHMSETNYPWTCAHGRPTIRHLLTTTAASTATDTAEENENDFEFMSVDFD